MKTAELLTVVRLFFVFILSVIAPFSGHCAAYTSLLSWTGWVGSSKATEAWAEPSGEISKLSFRGNNPPLLFSYDRKAADENGGTVSELENNQFYVILDSQPGDQFNFCFRMPPALSKGHFPSPPVFKKPVTGQAMLDIQNGKVRQVSSTPDTGRWQHEYSASWRLPAGHQSLVLAIEDNNNGWVIEPECSGIFSESAVLSSPSDSHTSANKKTSLVDIFYRNKQAEKNGSGHSDDKSRFSGPLAIPGLPITAGNGEPFTSSGGGGFGSGDDLDDLFKKRPGGGMGPLYSFEWMSELVNSVILVPGIDGRMVKKQIWDTRVVLKIKQGWNEQDIIISQELWDKIRAANLERSSGLFLALSRNPDDPEAVFDHYLSSNPTQPLQTEGYRRYAEQGFILSPKQLRSVSVFPGHVPRGIGHSDLVGQAGNQKGDVGPPTYAQSQQGYGRLNQGSSDERNSGDDDGSGGSPNGGLCQNCNKPVLAFNKCKECLDRESSVLEQELNRKQPGQDGEETEAVEQELSDDEQEQPTEELSSEMEQDSEAPKEADPSAVHVFQWFKTLESDGRQRGDCFRINDYYKFPELYKLLTQSFESDNSTLTQFDSKWVRFLNGSLSLYHLISEVGELAKSRGVEDYVEVTRIVKALAVDRDKFENETGLKEFRNELLNYLTTNALLASDDPGKVFYSGLGQQEKAELINFIFEIFSGTSWYLYNETVPSRFITIAMLNKLSRDVYAKYGFGLPDLDMEYQDFPGIIMWGCGSCGEHSFITPYNREYLGRCASESLHFFGLRVTINESGYFRHAEAMLTAMVIIRSMHGQRLRDMFPEHVSFAEGVPSEQLELLENFSIKANERLVDFLEAARPGKKGKFIQSMFLIFGMVPKELSDQLSDEQSDEQSDPESAQSAQAVSHLNE